MHDGDRQQTKGQNVIGRHLVGDQDHFFRRGDIEVEEERAHHHHEKLVQITCLAGILAFLFILCVGMLAELAAAEQRADAGGNGLQRDLGDDIGGGELVVQNAEQQEHARADSDAQPIGGYRVSQGLAPGIDILKTDAAGEKKKQRQVEDAEQQKPP
ncbi:hypothetical protein D3C86_1177210 [compost metagenome]